MSRKAFQVPRPLLQRNAVFGFVALRSCGLKRARCVHRDRQAGLGRSQRFCGYRAVNGSIPRVLRIRSFAACSACVPAHSPAFPRLAGRARGFRIGAPILEAARSRRLPRFGIRIPRYRLPHAWSTESRRRPALPYQVGHRHRMRDRAAARSRLQARLHRSSRTAAHRARRADFFRACRQAIVTIPVEPLSAGLVGSELQSELAAHHAGEEPSTECGCQPVTAMMA